MVKILSLGGALLVVFIAILFITAALKPAHFRVERRATIAAPPSQLFDGENRFLGKIFSVLWIARKWSAPSLKRASPVSNKLWLTPPDSKRCSFRP